MADFTSDYQNFKQSSYFLDIDPIMEPLHQFAELNQSLIDNSALYFQSFLPCSNESFFGDQAPEIQGNWRENMQDFIHHSNQGPASVELGSIREKTLSECSYGNSSSPLVPETRIMGTNDSRRRKRAKSKEKEADKPKEVVHVRARRGQATDSHSLAERVRRGKINERLRCLQDIVPGCYKTMGMAVMLDEIINYVRSLQNQVEFLSMKLTAASTYYDFNSESDAKERIQREKAQEAKELERLMREGYFGGLACFHSSTRS